MDSAMETIPSVFIFSFSIMYRQYMMIEKYFGMIWVLDILFSVITSDMPGHQGIIMVYAQVIRIFSQGESYTGQLGRDRVPVVVKADPVLNRCSFLFNGFRQAQ